MSDLPHAEIEDLETIGEKIVQMAELVKVAEGERTGAQAKWVFEMDGTLYRVVVTVNPPALVSEEVRH